MSKQNAFLNGLAVGAIIGLFVGAFSVFATCTAVDCPGFQQQLQHTLTPKR